MSLLWTLSRKILWMSILGLLFLKTYYLYFLCASKIYFLFALFLLRQYNGMVVSPSVSSAAALTLGSCSDSPSARIELQTLAETGGCSLLGTSRDRLQVSPCLCTVSQPKRTEVGRMVCLPSGLTIFHCHIHRILMQLSHSIKFMRNWRKTSEG